MKTAIVWFKTDLRLHDNETLIQALAQSALIVPVYCFDDAHFVSSQFGFKKTGHFRAQFLMESVLDLDKNLRALGSGLLVLKGKPELEIPKVVQHFQATTVFAKNEVASEEQQTEDLVKSELVKIHCNFQTFSTSTLYLAEDLPFPVKDIPDVFTHFRKATELKAVVRKAFAKPSCIKSPEIKPIDLPSFADLNLAFTAMDNRAALKFIGGETEAIARLNHYFFESRAISQYKETRNGLVGADYSSKFSAWLAHGCLSPRFIYQELKNYEAQFGANESSYWLVFELLWRDYFYFMMKKYKAKFFQLAGIQTNAQKEIKTNPQQLQDWVDGNTGIDFVDANMLELKLTGFMSNRGRQNVASFLCNDLNLDWRCGAAYFEQQLIDYDVCSNWGNWAYLAGVGNDPRNNRYFNIEKQAANYDKNKMYRNLWLDIL